jgi:nucleotide-binding universal stress UspA family protein
MVIRRIVVGTDESAEAAAALRWAATLADATTAQLTVVEAFAPQATERPPKRGRKIRVDLARQVESWVKSIHLKPPPRTVAVEARAEPSLLRAVRDTGADLLTVGSRPHVGVTRLGLGSLAHSLAHHVECPLVVVPHQQHHLVDGCIVVGVDGSESSRGALRWAEGLAAQVEAHVCAVHHVAERRPLSDVGTWLAVESMRPHGVATTCELVERSGVGPAELLRAVARERGAALIVVGTKERHSLGGHLLGLVPDALLHEPPVPVAVVPHAFASKAA